MILHHDTVSRYCITIWYRDAVVAVVVVVRVAVVRVLRVVIVLVDVGRAVIIEIRSILFNPSRIHNA